MTLPRASAPVRDRLLLACAELLDDAADPDVPTRAICELAGVQAPSLYHHFGSKQALLDAVVSHGFREFLAARAARPGPDDPIAAVRDGWDAHVRFGVEHPAFYAHIYGRVQRGRRCGVVGEVEAMILRTLEPAARAGRLTVPATAAAADILAASSGVTLALITTGADEVDWAMSARVRDAVLASVARTAQPVPPTPTDVAAAATALAAALPQAPTELGRHETALLRDWLDRLAAV
ncbi:TetR/AcrR family transcriptional regulator [Pseudonocardia humida]|uniref:TetR/AcrR family transcriptional regulator n=1 Tax=Pseudonocardia humida TaxID=2800819 RepID=A0ABT1ABB4_9PSEU|nr:TetR/AcrR family transcriptional regulator [Pseudonocardia humida]MCO1660104.1 TetR/AcrR family transcriptional regulator [Pseudonocardia humida]